MSEILITQEILKKEYCRLERIVKKTCRNVKFKYLLLSRIMFIMNIFSIALSVAASILSSLGFSGGAIIVLTAFSSGIISLKVLMKIDKSLANYEIIRRSLSELSLMIQNEITLSTNLTRISLEIFQKKYENIIKDSDIECIISELD